MDDINTLKYKVGGLLYIPAFKDGIADKILKRKYRSLTSVCFCLEDSIMDDAVESAEKQLIATLSEIKTRASDLRSLPLIFIRTRSGAHFKAFSEKLGDVSDIVTGFVFPKFNNVNGKEYFGILNDLNRAENKKFYGMPILESIAVADKRMRSRNLSEIADIIGQNKDLTLNVRVGGNDFCRLYGLRRNCRQTIYDISVVRDILTDILNMFCADYVVSGPVWEYFGTDIGDPWAKGLIRELELDRLNGFIGKTAIHPCQLPLIYNSLKVSSEDYNDAISVLDWKSDRAGVIKGGSIKAPRMNEVKCHTDWAARIKILGEIYGVR